ncbi:M48 family metallopeptidase [Aliiroseovarius sp. KMU-50]|uniref:M48 family metallopeptidase n=1 Tax=Aliiroseovarius salicola TaxID=3009082 RepID=A0ABT4VY92_9RHOB|nr:M48 family metallopeptidase [Aliiroseovarius sp. KMU-50]MDA5093223.1 M48 family metallopeptidase [Aliiroseovarius sp. KMU-50]
MSETQVQFQVEFDGFADCVAGHRAVLTRVGLRCSATGLELHMPDGSVCQWRWEDIRALRDQADRDGLVLFQKGAVLARLILPKGELADTIKSCAPSLSKRAHPVPWRKLVTWSAGAVASVAAIIFVLVPLMAAQLADILPPEGEKALGDTTLAQIRQVLGEAEVQVATCNGAGGLAALDHLHRRLLPEEDLPYPVDIHVFDHDLVNAFALPGGHVILFRGLIEAAEGPDEVAAVLAHEIGHVVGRDPTRDALRSAGSIGVLGLLFGDFAGGTVVLFLANQMINASYSQAAETAADEYAHNVLEREGISPASLGTFFQRLKDQYGDAEGLLAHLSTHPQLEKRILAAGAAVDGTKAYTPSMGRADWDAVRTMCGVR